MMPGGAVLDVLCQELAILEKAFSGELTKSWRNNNYTHCAQKELNIIKENYKRKYQRVENEYPHREIPSTWCWTNLGDIIELLSDYHSNGSYKILKEKVELLDEPNYAMMIRTTNFEKNNFGDLMKYITKDAYDFMEKSKLFGGEILINKIGNAGSSYYMPYFNKPASLAMNLFMLRIVPGIDSKYIYYHLNTIYSTNDIKQFVRGITTKTIDKKSINSLQIALPPLEEQKEIVRIIDSLFEKELEIKYICDMNENIDGIKKSILAKAFRGELGTNDLEERFIIEDILGI